MATTMYELARSLAYLLNTTDITTNWPVVAEGGCTATSDIAVEQRQPANNIISTTYYCSQSTATSLNDTRSKITFQLVCSTGHALFVVAEDLRNTSNWCFASQFVIYHRMDGFLLALAH